jgi:hypothetical protein
MATENPARPALTGTRPLFAFPIGENQLQVVFPEGVDHASAQQPANYSTEKGLRILKATVHDNAERSGADQAQYTRVTLTTEHMNGRAMIVDTLRAPGVRTAAGTAMTNPESRPFIQGIASIPAIQTPVDDQGGFRSRFEGLIATASCQKDGGANSNRLIDAFGFSFLHVEQGGPFNSLKVVGQKHVPGIDQAVERLAPLGLSPHVLWSGGEIRGSWKAPSSMQRRSTSHPLTRLSPVISRANRVVCGPGHLTV